MYETKGLDGSNPPISANESLRTNAEWRYFVGSDDSVETQKLGPSLGDTYGGFYRPRVTLCDRGRQGSVEGVQCC
jgi:hypothetical protein